MDLLYAVLILAGVYPLWLAGRANRATSLRHALYWAAAAWLAWGWALLGSDADPAGLDPARYVAVALTGCAGVAVLGARRPYVGAWNFVVLGLLAVMLLPLGESLVLGTSPVDPLRVFFLAATLAVGILNYLPTRLGPAALLLALGCGGELVGLVAPERLPATGQLPYFDLLVLLTPWAGWLVARGGRPAASEFDRRWLAFRDRLGLLWGQRAREQFNTAAANAGWPVTLYWQGLRRRGRAEIVPADVQDEMIETLRAILKRFMGEAARPEKGE
jgi:hypothetical protein